MSLSGVTILQVLPALRVGGAERGAVDIARAVVAAGGRAIVASTGGVLEAELRAGGGEVVVLPLASKNPVRMWRNVGALKRLIAAEQVDLVHARSRAPAWSAWRAARLTGRPFMTTFHAAYNFSSAPKKAYNAVMARGDRIIAISRFIADHVTVAYGVSAARLKVVPRGIDLGKFRADAVAPERVARLRERYGLAGDRPVVFLPGRMTEPKGQHHLLEAVARLGRPEVQVLLVGPDGAGGGYRARLVETAARLGLADQVRIAPACDDMPAAYRLCDIAVVASTQPEGFGRVAVEAQALGRPVIATAIGALPELVDPGVTGWLVPPADPDALAAALTAALGLDDAARARLAVAAVARVNPRYDVSQMTADTLAVYRELVAR